LLTGSSSEFKSTPGLPIELILGKRLLMVFSCLSRDALEGGRLKRVQTRKDRTFGLFERSTFQAQIMPEQPLKTSSCFGI